MIRRAVVRSDFNSQSMSCNYWQQERPNDLWRLHLADVDGHTPQHDATRFLQLVFQVHVAQIEAVHCRRHARRVRIPVEQVERERRFSEQIVVHHERPDQIVRTQHVESVRHLGAFEVAALVHALFEGGDLLLVDEHFKLARLLEIHQRGEKGAAGHAFVVLRGEVAQG